MKIIAILGAREEYLACEILKGLHRMGVELITSKPLNEYKRQVDTFSSGASNDLPLNQPNYTDEEIVEHSNDADYIFVFWNRFINPTDTNIGGRIYLVDKINQPDKTVVIDGSECSYTGNNHGSIWKDSKNYQKGSALGHSWIWEYMRERAKWYFKRETFPEDVHEHNIIPCPYSTRIEDRRDSLLGLDKDMFMVCVFGHLKTGLRAEVKQSCSNLKSKLGNSILVDGGIDREEYLKLVGRSGMIVDAWGAGSNCTVRRNEVVMNSTAVIGQQWEIIVPDDYTDGVNIINYKDINEFEEKVNYYFKNQDKLVEIGENGYQHALKYHTTEKRMKYIFDILEGKLEWKF